MVVLAKLEAAQPFRALPEVARRNDEAQRPAVVGRQRLAVGLPGDQRVVAHAEEGYTANVPIEFLRDPLSLFAAHADGKPLTPEHGGPLRLVIPRKYFWKSAKWLRGIELTANDRPGFWERYGYHNDADPFEEERYGF